MTHQEVLQRITDSEDGSMTSNKLAALSGLDSTTVNGPLRRAWQRGHLQRRRQTVEERVSGQRGVLWYIYRITPAGKEWLAQQIRAAEEWV